MTVIKRYTGSAWEIIGGGVVPNLLVAEQIVAGSPVTSISFTGLNANQHGGYTIVCNMLNATANENEIRMFANSDTTLTNYHSQCIYANGTSVNANLYNNARVFAVAVNSFTQALIGVDLMNSRMLAATIGNYSVGNTLYIMNFQMSKNTTDSNITSLSFVGNQNNGMAVGSSIRIYRRI